MLRKSSIVLLIRTSIILIIVCNISSLKMASSVKSFVPELFCPQRSLSFQSVILVLQKDLEQSGAINTHMTKQVIQHCAIFV